MFRLIQIVRNTSDEKEVQSTYEYEDVIEAKGEYETKLGNNMKSNLYTAILMILLDNEGDVVDQCKIGDHVFQPPPRPAYVVPNPNCCSQSFYNGCSCGA